MSLLDKSDEELLEIAQPMWDNLIHCSNKQDYFGFTQNFSARMLFGANEIELAKQWANNDVITSLTEEREFLGCLGICGHLCISGPFCISRLLRNSLFLQLRVTRESMKISNFVNLCEK